MRDVERAKMVPRGITSETLTSVTLLVVSFRGKYKLVSFVALVWIQIVLSAECTPLFH